MRYLLVSKSWSERLEIHKEWLLFYLPHTRHHQTHWASEIHRHSQGITTFLSTTYPSQSDSLNNSRFTRNHYFSVYHIPVTIRLTERLRFTRNHYFSVYHIPVTIRLTERLEIHKESLLFYLPHTRHNQTHWASEIHRHSQGITTFLSTTYPSQSDSLNNSRFTRNHYFSVYHIPVTIRLTERLRFTRNHYFSVYHIPVTIRLTERLEIHKESLLFYPPHTCHNQTHWMTEIHKESLLFCLPHTRHRQTHWTTRDSQGITTFLSATYLSQSDSLNDSRFTRNHYFSVYHIPVTIRLTERLEIHKESLLFYLPHIRHNQTQWTSKKNHTKSFNFFCTFFFLQWYLRKTVPYCFTLYIISFCFFLLYM